MTWGWCNTHHRAYNGQCRQCVSDEKRREFECPRCRRKLDKRTSSEFRARYRVAVERGWHHPASEFVTGSYPEHSWLGYWNNEAACEAARARGERIHAIPPHMPGVAAPTFCHACGRHAEDRPSIHG